MEQNACPVVSPYRWVVLGIYMLVTAMSQITWMTFAPIARDAAAVYSGGNADMIDLLAMLAMFSWLPLAIPAAWCIDNWGLKRGTAIGVILTGVCGFMRIFAPTYGWLLACMIGCAVAQPFVLNAFTKLAGNWFPEEEETLASGLLTMSIFIGLAIVLFTPGFVLAHYRAAGGTARQGIETILTIYGIPSLGSAILFFLFFREKPLVPPNPIAAEKKVTMTIGLKSLFKNKDFIYLMIMFFIGLGTFNTILTMIDTSTRGALLTIIDTSTCDAISTTISASTHYQ